MIIKIHKNAFLHRRITLHGSFFVLSQAITFLFLSQCLLEITSEKLT